MDHLTTFLTAMIALSVGVERVVEMIKGVFPWLVNSNNPRRPLILQGLAAIAGSVVAVVIGPNQFIWFIGKTTDPLAIGGSAVLLGLMASGGSAFWNHMLDLVGALKTTKENVAKAANSKAAR